MLAAAAATLALALPAVASAQEAAPAESHFGQRDSFVVSIERIFGFQGQKLGSTNNDSVGFSTALWLRGGILYIQTKYSFGGSDVTLSDVRPGADLLFAIEAVDHFGFLVGGHFELGMTGKGKADNPFGSGTIERDFKYMEAGLTAGLFTDF